MKKQILLFPFNGNAKEALAVIEDINSCAEEWEVLGFIDDDQNTWGEKCGGVEVLGGRQVLEKMKDAFLSVVPGRPDNFQKRGRIIESLAFSGNKFANIVHPSVRKGSTSKLGQNVLIMANVVITSGVNIGNNVIILPNTVISHDTEVGDLTIIGSNVSISGGVQVEDNCYVGTGARIIQEVQIGAGALIGMGAVVINDVPSNSVVAGNPAKIIRKVS